MSKCIYCGREVCSESAVDICEACGVRSFGVKMFQAIKDNMQQAQTRGDLEQGVLN